MVFMTILFNFSFYLLFSEDNMVILQLEVNPSLYIYIYIYIYIFSQYKEEDNYNHSFQSYQKNLEKTLQSILYSTLPIPHALSILPIKHTLNLREVILSSKNKLKKKRGKI